MQKRFDVGHTYLIDENNNSKEHTTTKREARVSKQTAQSYLLKWLDHQGAIAFTNADYGLSSIKTVPVSKRYEFEEDIVAKTTSKDDTCSYVKIKRNIPEVKFVSNSTFEDFKANAVGDFIEHTIKLEAPGTYNVKVKLKQNNNNGKYQLDIDGANQNSPIDMYLNNFNWTIIDLGNKTFYTPGLKKFRFKVVGKNELSTGYNAQIDYVELVPVNN
jgi:viroplasmin and RNaseH domain-containing protein